MKNIIKLAILMIFFIGMETEAKEDSKPKNKYIKNIVVKMRNGRENPDGTITYAKAISNYDYKTKTLTITCEEEGPKKCPVHLDIFMTIDTGEFYWGSAEQRAINLVKSNISQNQDKGKLVHNGMLYQWQNGKVRENGAIEMELKAVPLNTIIR